LKDDFKSFLEDVEKGISGKNFGIPTGFKELDKITNGIQKSIYTLIGGNSGTGKTSFVDMRYVLNPYDWLVKNFDKTNYRIHIIYNSMERNKKYKLAKWTCLKMFQDYKIIIDVPTVLGWQGKKFNLNDEYRQIIYNYEEYFEKMSDFVEIYSGAENPTGIYKKAISFFEKNGKVVKIDDYHYKYVPNNQNVIVILINDHIGKITSELNNGVRLIDKSILDKHTEYMGRLRDFYECSIVDISQFNRNISNIERLKNKDLSPEPDDFKGSGDMYENSDLCLALFNPFKLKVYDFLDYDIKRFVSSTGENRFRSLSVIKNTYGPDDIILGLNFLGENGFFREMPNAEYFQKDPKNYKKAVEFTN
jgi:hypothetical protein